jgi:hypothetical protein
MIKYLVPVLLSTSIATAGFAQDFGTFIKAIPEMTLNTEKNLTAEADAVKHYINKNDTHIFLQETEGEQYAIGKILLSKSVIIVYYSKPAGRAPLGKIIATSFTASGKIISSEAIGVFADFSGMHFHTSIRLTSQAKGAVSISSNVEAIKDNGEVNADMSKKSVYYFSAKGKITKL